MSHNAILNIADIVPAGEIIEYDPVYKYHTISSEIAEGNRGYKAEVLENGLLLTQDFSFIGFTTLTSELRGQTTGQTYKVATKDWIYAGIRVSDLYDEMMTDLRQEALA